MRTRARRSSISPTLSISEMIDSPPCRDGDEKREKREMRERAAKAQQKQKGTSERTTIKGETEHVIETEIHVEES